MFLNSANFSGSGLSARFWPPPEQQPDFEPFGGGRGDGLPVDLEDDRPQNVATTIP